MKTIVALALSLLAAMPALAASKNYAPGITDTEIKIGSSLPYSGPASAYGTEGKVHAAYFKMLNEQGGINGRKVNLISLDDGYQPPKTVENVRRLVEEDGVAFVFSVLGTSHNTAVQKYLNAKKVPHLFCATGSSRFDDPKAFPWSTGWQPSYRTEMAAYAKHIRATNPKARIAILYQNDDMGKDTLGWFKTALGDDAKRLIVAEASYETSDPTIDAQLVTLKASGADTFLDITTPKAGAQAVRKVHELGWKPTHYLVLVASSVGAVLAPAGFERAVGIISVAFLKDPGDPEWQKDPGYLEFAAFMKKYYPEGRLDDFLNAYAYSNAQTLAQVLRQAGDDLSRENIMRQAESLKDLQLPMALPGVKVSTSPTSHAPFKSVQLVRFDGKRYVRFGDVFTEN
jgi:ABC-type branched-subunit amino acid transport system substrate-binding protein